MSALPITRLYDQLSTKMGKETAENLTTFIDNKIDEGLESKTHIFATKEDLFNTKESLTGELFKTKVELTKEIVHVREDLTKEIVLVREDLSKEIVLVRENLTKEIALVRQDLSKEIANVKEDLGKEISKSREDFTIEIAKTRVEISKSHTNIIRWMFIFWAGQLIAFVLQFLKK